MPARPLPLDPSAKGSRSRPSPLRPGLAFSIACLFACIVGLGSETADAHGRSVSYSSWEFDETGADVSVRLKLLEMSRLGPAGLPPGTVAGTNPPGAPDLAARAFPRELRLFADASPCDPQAMASRRPDQPGWVRYEWRIECPTSPPASATRLEIESQILLAVAPSHMHFARVRSASDEGTLRERVLTEGSPRFVLRDLASGASAEDGGSSFLEYLVLGVEHILSGWDHLAFVLGLLLLARSLGEVARLITGFTLAHSLTLALAVLDIVHPRAAAVEAVIAFSVALVAIEKGWESSGRARVIPWTVLLALAGLGVAAAAGIVSLPVLTVLGLMIFTYCYFGLIRSSESRWLRICLTFAFGLVHGFGFAGILVEMTLPADRLAPALLGFNLGVEAGQIGVVALLWPLLAWARRMEPATRMRPIGDVAAASLCGLGVYWMAQRILA